VNRRPETSRKELTRDNRRKPNDGGRLNASRSIRPLWTGNETPAKRRSPRSGIGQRTQHRRSARRRAAFDVCRPRGGRRARGFAVEPATSQRS